MPNDIAADHKIDRTVDAACSTIYREARLLDAADWAGWVSMYAPDALFWVPAWLDEYTLTDNPKRQISLIYHDSRRGLEERIARIASRKSVTALPLPRTVHQISNIEILEAADEYVSVESVFSVHVYDPRVAKEHVRHGRYNHRIQKIEGTWTIAAKVIKLANDRIPTVLDFYSI